MEIENIEDFIKETNFSDLRKQKQIVVKATSGKPLTSKEKEQLEGLLNFLDAFQDMCVDKYGVSKVKVFPHVYRQSKK